MRFSAENGSARIVAASAAILMMVVSAVRADDAAATAVAPVKAPAASAPKSVAVKTAAAPKQAAKQMCVSADEATAFRLRHLQSRLMVAGLSCGQKDAYNTFVNTHKITLGDYGPHLIKYYNRTGGQAALNKYVTDLANAAASIRSDDPVAFCTHTWSMFLGLAETPDELLNVAAANPLPAVSQPAPCAIPAEKPAQQQAKTP